MPALRTLPLAAAIACAALALAPTGTRAGAQAEESLAPSVATVLSRSISDRPVPVDWETRADAREWIGEMGRRIAPRLPDEAERRELLRSVHYEAVRAGLDPQLVLAVIHHESGFRKYAVSTADARGYMQVMPFWTRLIGSAEHNLFHLRTNLRYGCVILRHYVDRENGDLFRALGRYNGSLGRAEYPNAVLAAMRRYASEAPGARTSAAAAH
ncbi:MAG: lytic transglycosylase domain-containing protein [Burkholderiales bacterium]|nr:lytic transglycosylase domain-containing protein [Burkholderiales bacterium]